MTDFLFLILLIILIPSVLQLEKSSKKIGFWLCFIIFIILSGLRGPQVGNDTSEYLRVFNQIHNGFYNDAESRYEIGYLMLNHILCMFSSNGQIIFIVYSVFVYYSFGRFILKYSRFPWLSLFLFLTYGFFSFSVTVVRQSIAISILLYSFDYLLKGNLKKFLIVVGVAVLFHTTAIFFVIAYPIRKFRLNNKTIILFLLAVATACLGFKLILNYMFSIFSMYGHYDGGKYFGEARTASIIYVILSSSIFFISYKTIRKKIKQAKLSSVFTQQLTYETFLVLIAVGFYILSLQLNILDRIAIYFNFFTIILLPNALTLMNKNVKGLFTLLIVLFFTTYSCTLILLRPGWNSVFPYSFCF